MIHPSLIGLVVLDHSTVKSLRPYDQFNRSLITCFVVIGKVTLADDYA